METGGWGPSNPELLKRAHEEVKIGNKNKIALTGPVICEGNRVSPCLARQAGSSTSQMQGVPTPADTVRLTRRLSPSRKC